MQRLILFAKAPLEGRAKTRLVPPLTTRQALGLYRAFVEDQLAWLEGFAGECAVELCSDGPWVSSPAPSPAVRRTLQGPGTLGERLERTAARALEEGAEAVVLVGADSPTLPSSTVRAAFRQLGSDGDVVIAPAADGGYVLLGLSRPLPALFRDVPWSTDRVCDVTRARLERLGIRTAWLEPWYDVDDASDLSRLRAELRERRARRRAPATASFLDALGPLDASPGAML